MLLTAYYASAFALIFVALSFNVIRFRLKSRIPFGDGKDKSMKRAIRVHGNFAEYVPITLIMIYFVETQGQNSALVHGLGSAFLLARISHIYGVSQIKENIVFRVFGLFITGCVLSISALTILL